MWRPASAFIVCNSPHQGLLLLSGFALAQVDKPAEHRTVGQVLNHSLTNVENEFVPSADAMPEDKYSFAPASGEFKGVRTFAQQIKHVAAVNYILGAAILGESLRSIPAARTGPIQQRARLTS
jgi:hypothetical protein